MMRFVHPGWLALFSFAALGCSGDDATSPGAEMGAGGENGLVGSSTSAGSGGGQEVNPSTGGGSGASVGGGSGGDTSGGKGGSGASGSGADAGGKAGSSGGAAGATGSSDAGTVVGSFPVPTAVNCLAATRPPSDSWQLIPPPNVVYTAAIATDPFATGTIWMNARSDSGKGQTGNGGLFKSTDCGSPGSWVWVTDPAK